MIFSVVLYFSLELKNLTKTILKKQKISTTIELFLRKLTINQRI